MGSDSPWATARPAVGMAVRAAVIGLLAFAGAAAVAAGFYATAVVIGAVAVVLGFDLARALGAADRALAQFVDGLAAEGHEQPRPPRGLTHFASALGRAQQGLAATRAERERAIAFLEALVDTVGASLLVLDDAGRAVWANRAARTNLAAEPGPLASIAGLGAEAAARIAALPGGGRDIVRLADGRSALAHAAAFSVPGQPPRRLVSVQSLSGDLDAVEVKAQHDLVRVLAHEMMNSLTPICSLSESLLVGLGQPEAPLDKAQVAAALEVVARRSAGLMAFVERYRKVADTPAAKSAPIAAATLAGELDRLMGPAMREAGVDFDVRIAPPDLTLHGDMDLLEHALINLLLNARDAVCGRGEARVRLIFERSDIGAALIVEDNGAGLPQADPEAAFVPFFTTKPAGSGVGLTLARQIALAHGGALEHRRGAAGGAVFRLSLPERA